MGNTQISTVFNTQPACALVVSGLCKIGFLQKIQSNLPASTANLNQQKNAVFE